MNDAPANLPTFRLAGPKLQGEGWSRRRWLTLIALVFAAHIAFIFALGERKQIVPRAVTNAPALELADDSDALLALNDPALFALPGPKDSASAVWLKMPDVTRPSFRFTEPPGWLPLSAENLGAAFQQFMRTNHFAGYPLDFKPPPELSEPVVPVEAVFPQNSTLQIVGGLAGRRLLNEAEIQPPPLPDNDVIAPSKVQALVDAGGNVVSVVLLESSGLAVADNTALELARAARFAPADNLTIGRLIFNWRTIPMTATNVNPIAH